MARFDLFQNPNPRATHGLLLDVQSDWVMTSTRWCVPLLSASANMPVLAGAQVLLVVDGQSWLLDVPNILAVPLGLLRHKVSRLPTDEQLRVESALDFMLRGY